MTKHRIMDETFLAGGLISYAKATREDLENSAREHDKRAKRATFRDPANPTVPRSAHNRRITLHPRELLMLTGEKATEPRRVTVTPEEYAIFR